MENSLLGTVLSIVVVCLLIFSGCGSTQETITDAVPLLFDTDAEDMTVQFIRDPVQVNNLIFEDLDGNEISTSNWRGKITLVNFWATWCGPCREEIPDLIKLQDRYQEHLQIIGISTDHRQSEEVKAFAAQMGINYPVAMATPELNSEFPGVFALPTSFILDSSGRVVQSHIGLISPTVLEQETRVLASLPTNVNIEFIEETQHTRLVNAAHATEIPGLSLSRLTAAQKEEALQRLNKENCSCGCALTLAQCRINDADCGVSLPLAEKLVEEILNTDS